MTYQEYVEQHLLPPLDLTQTGYEEETELLPHRTSGYETADGGGWCFCVSVLPCT